RTHLHGVVTRQGRWNGHQIKSHTRDARTYHIDGACRSKRQVNYAAIYKGTPVDNTHFGLLAICEVCDANNAAERQGSMRRNRLIHVENFATRCRPAVERNAIPGCDSLLDIYTRRAGLWCA